MSDDRNYRMLLWLVQRFIKNKGISFKKLKQIVGELDIQFSESEETEFQSLFFNTNE